MVSGLHEREAGLSAYCGLVTSTFRDVGVEWSRMAS